MHDIAGPALARQTRTRNMATAALVTALLSASAWIAIPLGAVPITLQVFFVVLAALLLPAEWAAASMGLYLLLGALGLPVFAGAHGGMGVLAGLTGGYLWGFLAGATLGALARTLMTDRVRPLVADAVAASIVIVVIYAAGAAQLAAVAGITFPQAIIAGVLPYVLPDIAKAAVAVGVAAAVRRARGAV